ncbi:MAG TPA: MMPL family transporter, partial [Spirochaetota bacterium]|nr:MMPL family transporter [Spirochaetota bacterium]
MYRFLERVMLAVCRFSLRHPLVVLLLAALVTIPAFVEVQKITIDPNLVRLLPGHSRASTNTVALSPVTGDGGYFTMVLSSDDTNRLVPAAQAAARAVRGLTNVHTVEFEWPVEFFKKFRYLLVPNDYLSDIYSKVLGWKSELSPAGVNLLEENKSAAKGTSVQSSGEDKLEGDIRQFATLSRYHFSADKKTLGMIIRTTRGIDDLQGVVRLYKDLTNVAHKIETTQKVTIGIAGSHRNKVDEYNVINDDLGLATIISGGLILLVTIIGFRSIRTAILVLVPLLAGMVWGFGLIPVTVKSLNLITSFLMLILTGMGIDYAIHLVKRVEQELVDKPLSAALVDAYRNTGPSVLVSGFTTALALFILAVSDFRGFSEFGIIAAMVIGSILISMVTFMPAAIVLGYRMGFVRPKDHNKEYAPLFSRKATIVSLGLVGLGLILTAGGLKFDASFRNLEFDRSKVEGAKEARNSQGKVYSSSFSPGAIYVAKDKANLDRLLEIFEQRVAEGVWLTDPKTNVVEVRETVGGQLKTSIVTNVVWKTNTTTIDVVRSLRDYAPLPGSPIWEDRIQTVKSIQEELREGDWISKITNAERRRWIEEMRDWKMPAKPVPAGIDAVPGLVRSSMVSKDGDQYLAAVFPSVDRKGANNAIRFTKEIYDLVPADQAERDRMGIGGVRGPVGETPVFAEIVMIVKSEV